MMTERERFLATARSQPVDRAFLLAPWVWQTTRERWQSEGLPPNTDLVKHFRTDCEHGAPLAMQGPYGPNLVPPLEPRTLEETADFVVRQDEQGNTVRLFKNDPGRSMPEWLAYPMKDRHDWETLIKPRLNARNPGRGLQGADLQRYAAQVRQRDYALGLWSGSFYGWPRSFLGVERISLLLYDDPALIHDMCEHVADFTCEAITPFLEQIEFDFAFVWEDMAGKSGPLCSPRTYREFMFGPLQRVTSLLRAHGVDCIIVDSDGNNDVLIPLWLEAGVTGLRPFEVAAHCDAVAIRRRYGRDLVIQGAMDKRALAAGPAAIAREVLSKVPWLCLQGGYFPQVDHLVPPDVSLANYTYYSQLLRAVVEDPERYLHEARRQGYWHD